MALAPIVRIGRSAGILGPGAKHGWGRRLFAALATAALGLAASCGGALSHRSVAEFTQTVPCPAGKTSIRIEIENGTIGVAPASGREVRFAGGVRRAADTAAELATLAGVPLTFVVVEDPAEPATLVLRGPGLPAGAVGVLGLELGVHLPAELPLAIVITGSGHVTLADRQAASRVKTARGDLRFERCAGGVQARTGRGNVIAFEHRGDVDIHTTVGDMQVFVREPGALVRLVTGQGTVQCHLPQGVSFEVDARVEIGRIGNGFGLVAERVGDYGAALVGRQGVGTTKVVLRTGSGHLSLTPRTFD